MSESMIRDDYCARCGRTFTAQFDALRAVFEIGCARCDDGVSEQIALYALTYLEPETRAWWMARLSRLGVSVEALPALAEGGLI